MQCNRLLIFFFFVANLNCRNLNLLSFGEETEEEEKELALVKKKIVSSHDVLNDPRLLRDENLNNELVISEAFHLVFPSDSHIEIFPDILWIIITNFYYYIFL